MQDDMPTPEDPEKPEEPEAFVCISCGRVVYSMRLAPFCLRCRRRAKVVFWGELLAMAKTLRGAILVRITAPHVVARIVALDGKVARAAPIVAYMMGWDGRKVARYCDRRLEVAAGLGVLQSIGDPPLRVTLA